ncbi:hypothetical protein ALC62_09335 [Cyphomyrmex costatus]|uniref:Uncharacterized protein n=1 Tax=Cyphomyrmex costatus TaxID=456900 RepID=A0A195CG71_9HYME|nr:hypothetical protein ALC62_09335 [Cyphomyrmex costatus]
MRVRERDKRCNAVRPRNTILFGQRERNERGPLLDCDDRASSGPTALGETVARTGTRNLYDDRGIHLATGILIGHIATSIGVGTIPIACTPTSLWIISDFNNAANYELQTNDQADT